jgi:hypothetical protein
MKLFSGKSLKKKADLNLSINAIVVLILAITMLALGLTFIRSMFSKGIDSTLKNLDQLEEDRKNNLVATCNEDVCLEKTQMQIKRGEKQSLIAVIYNKYPCPMDGSLSASVASTPISVYVARKDDTHLGGSTSNKFLDGTDPDCSYVAGTTPAPLCRDISITSMQTQPIGAGAKQWIKLYIQPAANSALTQYRYNVLFSGQCSDSNMKIDSSIALDIEVVGS